MPITITGPMVRAGALVENVGGRAAQLEGGLGGDGLDIGDATDAVGAEETAGGFGDFLHEVIFQA
ncbi:MAG: hypothetical protein QM796_18100 [Chthoniobacteraceae bacterium]